MWTDPLFSFSDLINIHANKVVSHSSAYRRVQYFQRKFNDENTILASDRFPHKYSFAEPFSAFVR